MCKKSTTCMSKSTGKPLTEYYSELEAERSANIVQINRGNNLIPYRCNKCRYWHLAPKERHTPSRRCYYCGKDLYETQDAAEKRADILYIERGVQLRVYFCNYQYGWHLTSKCR